MKVAWFEIRLKKRNACTIKRDSVSLSTIDRLIKSANITDVREFSVIIARERGQRVEAP